MTWYVSHVSGPGDTLISVQSVYVACSAWTVDVDSIASDNQSRVDIRRCVAERIMQRRRQHSKAVSSSLPSEAVQAGWCADEDAVDRPDGQRAAVGTGSPQRRGTVTTNVDTGRRWTRSDEEQRAGRVDDVRATRSARSSSQRRSDAVDTGTLLRYFIGEVRRLTQRHAPASHHTVVSPSVGVIRHHHRKRHGGDSSASVRVEKRSQTRPGVLKTTSENASSLDHILCGPRPSAPVCSAVHDLPISSSDLEELNDLRHQLICLLHV